MTADSGTTIEGYTARFTDSGRPLPVLIECDTDAKRCGVQTPEDAVEPAGKVAAAPGLRFDGLMIYPSRHKTAR